MCATGEPLPFDQLLIELHGCEESLVAELVECLDKHGIYPFSREENPHQQLCGKKPSLGFGDVEMAFVRAQSRFTHHYMPTAASASPALALSSLSTPPSTAARTRKARRLSATRTQQPLEEAYDSAPLGTNRTSIMKSTSSVSSAAVVAKTAGSYGSSASKRNRGQQRRLSGPSIMGHGSSLSFDVRGLGGFTGRGPKLFMVDWNKHVQQWRLKHGAQGEEGTRAAVNGGAGSGGGSGISMKHTVLERGEIAREMRQAWVHLGSASHAAGYGAGWAHMEMGRCTSSPAYLLDLFEPRGWCLEKRWSEGFDFQPGGGAATSSSSSSENTRSGRGARALCLPEAHHNRGGSHGQHSSNHDGIGRSNGGGGILLRACEVTPALGAQAIVFDPMSAPKANAEPGSAAYRASAVATTLGCVSSSSSSTSPSDAGQTHLDATTSTGGGSAQRPLYRVLTADASTDAEWLALGQAACGGKASAYTTYTSGDGGGTELGSGLPLKHKALSKLYDQLVRAEASE